MENTGINKAGLIVICGSSGSGKTSFALAVANAITKKKKNVVCLSANSFSPGLIVWTPSEDVDNMSIQDLLLNDPEYITDRAVISKIVRHPQNNRLGFLSVGINTNPLILNPSDVKRTNLLKIIEILSTKVDYIIFDCESMLSADTLSSLAIQLNNTTCIRLITPDMRGIAYESSINLYLNGKKQEKVNLYKALSPIHKNTPFKYIENIIGKVDFYLPCSDEISSKVNNGELLEGFTNPFARGYETVANIIATKI